MTRVFLWITRFLSILVSLQVLGRSGGISEQTNNAYNPRSDPHFPCNEPPTY